MAWYNTYRPQNFNDVIGQNLVKTVLRNALEFSIIKHAYLFSGPKGTGKTTLARIFANCLNQTDLFPEARLDIIELDAASNTGVDDVRQLIENSNVPPISGRYKVYIIDEVHMLSKQAMNALLKTLEEPPAYLVFLLATTNPEKLLPTVLSRLTKLNLTSHSISNIADRLKYIAQDQKMIIDEASLILIAKRSNGGQRDAINLLETLHSYNLSEYTLETTSDLLGLLPEELLEQISTQLLAKTLNSDSLDKVSSFNLDGETLLGQLLDWALEKSLNNNPSFDKLIIPLSEVASMKLPITNPLHSLAIVQVKLSNEVPIEIKTEIKTITKPIPEKIIEKVIQKVIEKQVEEIIPAVSEIIEPFNKPNEPLEKDLSDPQTINQYLISLKSNNDCPMTLKIMLSDLGVENINENQVTLSISNGVFMTQIKSVKNIDYLKQKLFDLTERAFEIEIIQRTKKEIPNFTNNLTIIPPISEKAEEMETIEEVRTETDRETESFNQEFNNDKTENKIFYQAYNQLAPNMENTGVAIFKPPITPPTQTENLQDSENTSTSNKPIKNDDWKNSIADFDLED